MNGTPNREVILRDVPVATYRATQQHTDAVLRELVLMAEYETAKAGRERGPMRMLFDRASAGFADRLDLTVQAARAVDAAIERGDESATVTVTVPARYAASAEAWSALVDDLDALCRDGTMLSVPVSPEARRFTQWWCAELVRQLRDGAEPVPWPDYVAAVGSLA